MSIQTGQKAPAFSLYNSNKELVSLADYEGKNVLLLFFPLAFTSTCTVELCAVRDSIGMYQSLQTDILGISVDSLYTLGKFKAEQNLNFPLLADFNKEVSIAYDCLYEKFSYGMKGVSKRAAFIVDATGHIAYAEVLENASEQPDFERIKATLSGLSAIN